ncbi:MAG: response regulator [Planctomycetota bacterium]
MSISADKTLMIVDDSPLIRRVIRKAATQAGFQETNIREAENGQVALDQVHISQPDVVLLDINMPVMDGEQFMISIDKEGKYGDMAVLIVSTEVNAARLVRLAGLGAKGRLKKPFEPEELQDLLNRVCGDAA